MTKQSFRQRYLTTPIFNWAKRALPTMSETEREALEAGEVWWDAQLFTGKPDWAQLLRVQAPRLSKQEQEFLDGPVNRLCAMLDDWDVTWREGDLPQEVWDFLKAEKFFGMIIPREFGGLEFSAFAHSEVVRKIATVSITAAVTVMVPNSLGPGELLLQYGTDEQRKYWLPRLAAGTELPAFALTSPEAGSDAAAMDDEGTVCKGKWRGETVLGIRLRWRKRYITLGPVCSILGLAFKLRDPDNLLRHDKGADIGITVALVPTDLAGVDIGRRHLPAFQMFQNGPTTGEDVFIPLDHVIGGREQVGKGWAMLMSALAAGRGISLPSMSAAAGAFTAHATGAYARVREQFNVPIGKFEGVQVRLAHLAGRAYLLDSARRLTCAGLDEGRKLAVISAIMKAHATYKMRESINDAMDIHAGKAVIDGPLNYLGNLYRAMPVAITVEGANILTRNLIIFGQGAIRCHPFLLDEMLALKTADEQEGFAQFDRAFWGHVSHAVKNFFRAWFHSWTGGLLASAPSAGRATRYYKQLSRYAAVFSLSADFALLTLGGDLKRKEMLSARLGDVLSELYLQSAVLKRWEDDQRPAGDFVLVELCLQEGLATIRRRLDAIYANMPNRAVALLLRFITLPGGRQRGASDRLLQACAEILINPSDTRDRLTENIVHGRGDDGLARVEAAYQLALEVDPLRKKMRAADISDWRAAKAAGVLTASEAKLMERYDAAVARAIAVDDFPPGAFARKATKKPDAVKMTTPKKAATTSKASTKKTPAAPRKTQRRPQAPRAKNKV